MLNANHGIFIGEYVSLSDPREKFGRTFAAGFLMPASKVRAIIEKELCRKLFIFS
jgi:hypothetical protein